MEKYEEMKDGEMYKCPYCPRKFKNRRGLWTHIGRKHKEHFPPPSVKKYKCPYCPRKVKTQRG